MALPYEGARDSGGIVVAVEGVPVAASIVTLATLRRYAPKLATSLRQWRLRQPRAAGPTTLTVRGPGLGLAIDLPPNVSTQQLLTQLAPLLDAEQAP